MNDTERLAELTEKRAKALWPIVMSYSSPWDNPGLFADPGKEKREFTRKTIYIVKTLEKVNRETIPHD